jgi:TetR/AcrR family transcriptional regulator, transcriptional repressor for nem operon
MINQVWGMAARDTRGKIIEAAMELFWLKGYGSTSIADILSRSQVNSGSLYHYFPGKQDVLVAVLEAYRDGIGPMLLEPAWAGVDDPIERIFALLAKYRQLIVDTDCEYGCPIGSLALELHEADPIVRQRMAENFTNWAAAIRTCLEQAPERLPQDADLKAIAEFVLTAMEGGVMQARTYRDVAYFDRTVSQLRAYFDALAARARVSQLGEVL